MVKFFAVMTVLMFLMMLGDKNVKYFTVGFCVSMALTAAVYLLG